MNNLIKAEFFRLRHSGSIFGLLIIVSLTGVLFSYVGNTLEFNMATLSAAAPVGILFCVISTASLIGSHYQNRTAYYEIMDGKSHHDIILSRLLLYSLLITVGYFIPVSVLLLIFDFSIEAVRFLSLLYFILLRLLVFTVCLVLIFKTAAGVVLVFPRIIFEILLISFERDGSAFFSSLRSLMKWLPMCQCSYIGEGIDSSTAAKVLIGFIIETAVMYLLAYMSFKKKWMIKTTLH